MCILVILRRRVEGWPLIVGANRDEYRDRPWDAPRLDGDVLAPRDRRAGGTWIGANRSGLLVAVTNRPEPDPDASRPSRGLLALDLLGEADPAAARARLEADVSRQRRNGFRVLLATADDAILATHPGRVGPLDIETVGDGVHWVTNRHGLDVLDHRGALDGLDDSGETDLDEVLARLRRALGTHEDRGPGGRDAICKHGEERGTLSSTIVALPEAVDAPPVFLMAPGAPCRAAWEDLGGELGPRGPRLT